MNYRNTVVTVSILFTVCISLVLPGALAHQTPPPYPQLEPNDQFSTATEIEPRTLHGLDPIKFTNESSGPKIGGHDLWEIGARDEDVYAVDLKAGDGLPVTLYHDGEAGNLEFTIYDPSKAEITTVDPDGNWKRTGSSLFPEGSIHRGNKTVTARCSGTYYIKVENEGRQTTPYRLEVDDRFEHNDERNAAPLLSDGNYEGLMITTYDKDFYRLHAEKGEEVDIKVNITPHAHWEIGVDPKPIRHAGRDVSREEWQPDDHPRWRDPSFKFRVGSGGLSGPDYDIKAVSQVKNDELHQDRLLFEAEETGTFYISVWSNHWWTSPIDGASKWNANSARYSMNISRDARTAAGSTTPNEDDEGTESVKSAFDRIDDQLERDDVGIAGSQLAGETINAHIGDEGVYSFEVNRDLEITGFQGCGREDATLRVEADRETINRIGNSNTPSQAFHTAFQNNDIRIRGVTTINKVKWTIFNGVNELVGLVPI